MNVLAFPLISEDIDMSCNICLESGELIRPCSCTIEAHFRCIKSWHSTIGYGKVIKSGNLRCPQCKAPGKSQFMSLFKNDKEIIDVLATLNRSPDWTHILCPSCHEVKKYVQESCSVHIDDTYRLVCNDCSPKAYKECPNCGILIEKGEGCLHMECNCGTHFCWLCLEIHDEKNIYKHIDENHENILEEQLQYENYLYRTENNNLKLNQVPEEYWTKELILRAVKKNFRNFGFVKNPNRELCLAAVKQNGRALKYVKKQDRELCLEAVKQYGPALEYVEEQDKEICLEAVKQKGWALKFVKEQDKEICLEAVKQDGHTLKYVEEQTTEICLEAVKQNGLALEYVEEQDIEICLEAIRKNGQALEHVKEQTREICLEAVKKYGEALKYVEKQDREICLEAVKQNGWALQYATMQDREICSAAVKQNKYVLHLVEKEFKNEID